MNLTGAEILLQILKYHDVDKVFGYPGGAALNLYDALYLHQDEIEHIMTAHEQGAAHGADGYARSTWKTGVVIATSGPGATNLVTGIATAYMDSVPLVAITNNVPDSLIGRDSFQEVDIVGISMPITKHNYFVRKIEDLPEAIFNAFRIAQEGRKGPVLVDITKNVTSDTMDFDIEKFVCQFKEKHKKEEKKSISEEELKTIADVINKAERPLLYYGGGVKSAGGKELLRDFITKAGIPASHTTMGAGTVDYNLEYNLGLIGMHGTIVSNKAVDEADVLIALGTRFSDRVALNPKKFGEKSKIIHVDVDPSELNKNVSVEIGVEMDLKDFLEDILPYIEKREHAQWLEHLKKLGTTVEDPLVEDFPLHPKDILETICKINEADDIDSVYVTDVGQHQMWAAQYLKHRSRDRFLTSGGLGTMGYGYGGAIGAKVARPEKRVVHLTGDGSLHMNLQEAVTAVSYNLPIITVLFDNQVLGMVYQWQSYFYEGRHSSSDPHRKTDYIKLIEAFGGQGYKVSTIEDFEKAYSEACKAKGPVWIQCQIHKEERVLPMIPSGGTSADMIIG